LEELITVVVQRVVRKELQRDYYVNERGVRVLYTAEEIAPDYLAELQTDYKAIQESEAELISREDMIQELHDLGLDT